MKHPRSLLWKLFVRGHYRQNAGFFLFFFLIFFGIVAPSQQIAYHYALIRGIVATPPLLALVFFLWLLYAAKCVRWILGHQRSPEHFFLHLLPQLGGMSVFQLLLEIQIALYAPIICYAIAILVVAFHQSAWMTAIVLSVFILFICLFSTAMYLYDLFHPGRLLQVTFFHRGSKRAARKKYRPYWSFLMRSFLSVHTTLLAGIKIFGCGILYLLLKTQTPEDYDIRMPFLTFSMAVFGHGVLIYQMRSMEEGQLMFYRSMPLSLPGRWAQYGILYLLVLLPEMITLGWLMPDHIRLRDAFGFVLSGYSTLLLMNSCLFIAPLKKSDFLKLILVLFGILYFGVLSANLILLSGLFLVAAGGLFFRGYCRWEG